MKNYNISTTNFKSKYKRKSLIKTKKSIHKKTKKTDKRQQKTDNRIPTKPAENYLNISSNK